MRSHPRTAAPLTPLPWRRRLALPFTLATLLFAATATAAPLVPRTSAWGEGWWAWVTSWIPRDEGCILDPYGRCAVRSEPLDAGCGLDPYGRCGQ